MTTINSVELNIEDKLVGIASTSSPSDLGLVIVCRYFRYLERHTKHSRGKETLVALSTANQISSKV